MFRFTIRELVLLTLVVAMGLGLWIARSEAAALRNEAADLRADRDTLQQAIKASGFEMSLHPWGGPHLVKKASPQP